MLYQLLMKHRRIFIPVFAVLLAAVFSLLVFFGIVPLPINLFPGSGGHLSVQSIGIELPLVQVNNSDSPFNGLYAQFIVHQKDCGALFWQSTNINNYGAWLIADHNFQGFDAIHSCQTGDCATLQLPNGETHNFVVSANFTGHNTQSKITDENGNNVITQYPYCLILYTCLDTWENVQIVVLSPDS